MNIETSNKMQEQARVIFMNSQALQENTSEAEAVRLVQAINSAEMFLEKHGASQPDIYWRVAIEAVKAAAAPAMPFTIDTSEPTDEDWARISGGRAQKAGGEAFRD